MRGSPYPATHSGLINRGSPHAKDLLAWWPLTRARSQEIPDRSGRGNHGTTVTGVTWGHGARFDGSSSLVTAPNLPSGSGTERLLLVAAWVIPAATTASLRAVWRHSSMGWYQHSGNNWQYYNGGFIDTGVAAVSQQLTHLVFQQDEFGVSGDVRLYVNGVLRYDSGGGADAIAAGTADFTFGGDAFGQLFNGQILDMRVYKPSKIWSNTQVWSLYDPRTRWDLYATKRRQCRPFVSAGLKIPVAMAQYRQRWN